MCIFTAPIDHVGNTSIFARLSGTGTQFLVYQMNYQASQPLAMILPLPVALPSHERSVRFIDLKGYPDFFSDMDSGFFLAPFLDFLASLLGRLFPKSAVAGLATASALPIEMVGDFVASFVPTLNDFDRLDPRFVLPHAVWDQIPTYHDYGFAVFQLKGELGQNVRPHPMAFEFPTRHPNALFFPTVHIHDGHVHSNEHFEHDLYMQGTGPQGDTSNYNAETFMKTGATAGIARPDARCGRITLDGDLPNRDTFVSIFGDPSKLIVPGGVAAVLTWVLARRLRASRQRSA